ncbi:minor capsid protein [Companilactobacillus sp. DQM5]|uniref:minor capsid protein n=1 Tax=Companilactobacillus sp. DQM5 TaxID=3463359 RepID=UPI0040585EBE
MTIKIKVDLSGINEKFSVRNIQYGKTALANQMLSDMNNEVPLRDGYLRNSGHIERNSSQLVWDTPYAHRQYSNKYRHPRGGSDHWDKKAKSIYGKQWVEVFKKGAKF